MMEIEWGSLGERPKVKISKSELDIPVKSYNPIQNIYLTGKGNRLNDLRLREKVKDFFIEKQS